IDVCASDPLGAPGVLLTTIGRVIRMTEGPAGVWTTTGLRSWSRSSSVSLSSLFERSHGTSTKTATALSGVPPVGRIWVTFQPAPRRFSFPVGSAKPTSARTIRMVTPPTLWSRRQLAPIRYLPELCLLDQGVGTGAEGRRRTLHAEPLELWLIDRHPWKLVEPIKDLGPA